MTIKVSGSSYVTCLYEQWLPLRLGDRGLQVLCEGLLKTTCVCKLSVCYCGLSSKSGGILGQVIGETTVTLVTVISFCSQYIHHINGYLAWASVKWYFCIYIAIEVANVCQILRARLAINLKTFLRRSSW